MREQLESERRRGEAELRGEIRKEMDKLREEVAEVQVFKNDDGDHTGESMEREKGGKNNGVNDGDDPGPLFLPPRSPWRGAHSCLRGHI